MNDRSMAESHGGGVFGVLVRILCVVGGAVIGAFVLAVLAPGGAGTAHAAEQPSDTGAFWAEPDSVSSAAARRAEGHTVTAGNPTSVQTPRPADDPGPRPSVAAHRAPIGAASTMPAGSGGSSGGSTDGGPSTSPLAVLSSALVAVLWLSQRLRHREVRARSAFVTLSLERPG